MQNHFQCISLDIRSKHSSYNEGQERNPSSYVSQVCIYSTSLCLELQMSYSQISFLAPEIINFVLRNSTLNSSIFNQFKSFNLFKSWFIFEQHEILFKVCISSCARQNDVNAHVILSGAHRSARHMRRTFDTCFTLSLIYHLYVLFVWISYQARFGLKISYPAIVFTMVIGLLNCGSVIVHILLLGTSSLHIVSFSALRMRSRPAGQTTIYCF